MFTSQPATSVHAPPDPGSGDLGGLDSSWDDFVVFRTADGALMLAHHGYPSARVAGGGEARGFRADTHQLGAAPRPSGGYLVTHGYSDRLVLTSVDAEGAERAYELDRVRARTASTRIGAIVAPATPGAGERAHVVVPTTSSTFLHFEVDLATGAVARERVGW